MADINDLKTNPANPIEGINVAPNKPITLGAIFDDEQESETNKARRRAAIEGVDTTNAEVLEGGTKIITPDMIPTTEDPNAPKIQSMEEKDLAKLHDVITQKKKEAADEINEFINQTKVNEQIATDKNIQFDEDGDAINEDGSAADELTEDENLEAALDMEIAAESKGLTDLAGVPAAPMFDPNHEYEQVSDEEFDALMAADDEVNGKFEDDNLERNKALREKYNAEVATKEELAEAAAEVQGYDVEPGDLDDEPQPLKPEPAGVKVAPISENYEVPAAEAFTVVKDDSKKEESLDEELKDAGVYDADEDLSAEEDKKEFEEFVSESKKTFGLAPDRIDLSGFTEMAPVSATSVLSSLTTGEAHGASDWVLQDSKTSITLSKFSGVDLKNLADVSSGRRNSVNNLYEEMSIIYKHDMNPNKPDTVEGWAKSIASTDLDDLWFDVYDAAFHNANHIPCNCENPKCQHSFISQHIPIEDMVKYPDEEFKQEFMDLRNSAPKRAKRYNPAAKLIPITDTIAVAVKPADLYDFGFIIRLIGQEFYAKYKDVVDILPNIENFYRIDLEKRTKQPISVKPRESAQGDSIKEIKNRIIIYNRIIKTLDSDQYALLVMYASKESVHDDDEKRVKYEIPEIICPKCGKPIPAKDLSNGGVKQLVFDRRPLAAITIS